MEYLQLTQHILTENKIFERNLEDNCYFVLKDFNDFNLSNCLNNMNNEFFLFVKHFYNAFLYGFKKKFNTISFLILLFMIIIFNIAKSASIILHPIHIICIVIFQMIIILIRKCIWSFILNQKKNSAITPIVKIGLQKFISYHASKTLQIFIFNYEKTDFKNQFHYYAMTLFLFSLIYIYPIIKQNTRKLTNLKNYIGLIAFIIVTFCESMINRMIYSNNLSINDPLTMGIIDIFMEWLISYIINSSSPIS